MLFLVAVPLAGDINNIYIVSNIDGSVFTNDSKTASINDTLRMSIVGNNENNGEQVYYSNSTKLQINGQVISESNIQNWAEINNDYSIKWFKVEEANGKYYNNTSPSWHWEDIPYKETEIIEWRDRYDIIPCVEPTIFRAVFCNGKTVGTMRFKVTLTINGITISTPGKDSKYKGSISDKVHRISLKGNTGNEIINHAYSLCNLPYIWGSESFTGSKWDNHQSELFIGADCADFAVAAYQLAGYQIPYDEIRNNEYTDIIATVYSYQDKNLLNINEEIIVVGKEGIQIGDFIYWNYNTSGGHVALFLEDKSDPNGEFAGQSDRVFNEWDLVIQTLFHEPEVKSVGDAYHGNVRVYRYRD